jgi:hypothetical protein
MNEKKDVPFFVRFLEGNVKQDELKNLKGGHPPTLKYPSDHDEG